MIPLAQPDIGEEEIRLVNEVIRSGWLSMGYKVGKLLQATASCSKVESRCSWTLTPDTLNMDVERIKAAITKNTKAILPVHVFGQPCEMVTLTTII